MARRYGSFTPARRAALRRAQLASAAKRRGRRRQIATGFALGAGVLAVTAGGYAGHQGLKVHRGNQILRAQAMKNHPVSRSRGLSGIQINFIFLLIAKIKVECKLYLKETKLSQ